MFDIAHPYEHMEYSTRLVYGDISQNEDVNLRNHATAVAGIIVAQGLDEQAIGMAYDRL